MPLIDAIEVHAVRLPLEQPLFASQVRFAVRDYVLIRILCDDGSIGRGFTYVGTTGAVPVARIITDMLKDVVIGKDPAQPDAVWRDMFAQTLIQGRTGIVMNAMSAIDIALWDRNARVAGQPLYRFLGAGPTHSVPAYASGGYYGEELDLGRLKAEIESYVDMGFDAVKIKTGRLSPEDEERRVATVREALGSERTMLLDAYHSWQDEETAMRYIDRMLPYNPAWIEDPLPPDQLGAYARLARKFTVPLATGEFYAGIPAFSQIVEQGSARILQPEAPRCGGITEWRKIAKMVDEAGLSVCPCWFHDLHAQLAPSSANVPMIECFTDFKVLNFGRLIDKPLVCDGGRLVLSDEPGLGFDFDMDIITRHSVQ